jgi:hypothetical protein
MDPIELALADLNLQDKTNISDTAKRYNVDRSTLSRRFNLVTKPATIQYQQQQVLTVQQEQDLVEYINRLTEKGILQHHQWYAILLKILVARGLEIAGPRGFARGIKNH